MADRLCINDSFDTLLKSELERAINETILSREDQTIARLFLLEKYKHADIASVIYRDRSTVTRRIPGIISKIAKTVEKLDFRNIFTTLHIYPTRMHPVWGFLCYAK